MIRFLPLIEKKEPVLSQENKASKARVRKLAQMQMFKKDS